MAKSNTEKKVLPLLEPIVAERGLELVDLEFVKEGANWYLRVYIDKEEMCIRDRTSTARISSPTALPKSAFVPSSKIGTS